MYSSQMQHSSLINISFKKRIALQFARKIASCDIALNEQNIRHRKYPLQDPEA